MVSNLRNRGLDANRHWVPFSWTGTGLGPDEVMIATRLIRGITPHGVIHTITPDRVSTPFYDFARRIDED